MARLKKYKTGIVGVIKHNIRDFKNGKCPTNMEVFDSWKPYTFTQFPGFLHDCQGSGFAIVIRITVDVSRF